MHPGELCKRFFCSTRSLFLPLPHQHPLTKAQRDNSKTTFRGEDPSVEGRSTGLQPVLKRSYFAVKWDGICHLEQRYFQCTEKQRMHGKIEQKKAILT